MIQYIVKMRRKQKILFKFWLAEKIQTHMKFFFFLIRERKKGKLISITIRKTASQNNIKAGVRIMKGPARCRLIYRKKSNFEKENFYLILEVNNLLDMMYGSHDERELPPAKRRVK